jgi:hypothetical protein
MARVVRVDLPQRSVLKPLYAKAGFADAFAIDLPSNATGDAERLAAHMLMGQSRWVGWLIALIPAVRKIDSSWDWESVLEFDSMSSRPLPGRRRIEWVSR